jgi:hypothetical protein
VPFSQVPPGQKPTVLCSAVWLYRMIESAFGGGLAGRPE